MISFFRWRLGQFPSRQYGTERTDLPRNPVPETHISVLPLSRQFVMICFLYRLRFIQWCRSNLRNRNDKQNKAEILWNLTQHTRRENYSKCTLLEFYHCLWLWDCWNVPDLVTSLLATGYLIVHFDLFLFCCDFQISISV